MSWTSSAEFRRVLEQTAEPLLRNALVECLVGRGDAEPDEFRLLRSDGTEHPLEFSVPYLRRLRRVRAEVEAEHRCEDCR